MAIHQQIYNRLIEAARNEELIHYGEIAPMANLNMESQADRNEIGRILGEISEYEHSQGRPMLSAIVVHVGGEVPGEGFFNLARQLGRHHGRKDLEDIEFFAMEARKVFNYWKSH